MTPDERYDKAVAGCTHVSVRPCGACVTRAIDEAEADVLKAPGGIAAWLRQKRAEIEAAETANEAERGKLDYLEAQLKGLPRYAEVSRRAMGGRPARKLNGEGDPRRKYWNTYYQRNKAKILAKANARNARARDGADVVGSNQ